MTAQGTDAPAGTGSAGTGSTGTSSTGTSSTGVPGEADDVDTLVASLAESMVQVVRSVHRAKAQLASQTQPGGEWWAYGLLHCLLADGPQRITALAELTHSDASTVSRQVAGLVKCGLIDREADPDDRRATMLVATARGRQAHAAFRSRRNEQFARMLAGWSPADLQMFERLLGRFAVDLQRHISAELGTEPGTSAIPPAQREREESSPS